MRLERREEDGGELKNLLLLTLLSWARESVLKVAYGRVTGRMRVSESLKVRESACGGACESDWERARESVLKNVL